MKQSSRSVYNSCTATCPSGKKYVCLVLLTKQRLYILVDVSSKGQDLLAEVCNYLGLNETKLFGLAMLSNGEYIFIDQNIKLAKYAPKGWRNQAGSGVDATGVPYLTLYLLVQFYVDSHLLISDKIARHHYYLQLRENVIKYRHSLSDDRAFILAAYALQADVGNLNKGKHHGKYFEPSVYFPSWILERLGEKYIIQHLPKMHQDNWGLSKTEAQAYYIKEASDTKAAHNMHLFSVKRKKGKLFDDVWLGICCNGIEIYEENLGITKRRLSSFSWPGITKLHFDKKKFEIIMPGQHKSRKFIYYGNSEEVTKNILFLCKLNHQFSMVIQPKLQEMKKLKLDGEEKNYRESYIYSDNLDLAWEQEKTDSKNFLVNHPRAVSSNINQPVSNVSSLSSNTSSGILSDKIQNHELSEADLDVDEGFRSPPKASLESLTTTSLHSCRLSQDCSDSELNTSPESYGLDFSHSCNGSRNSLSNDEKITRPCRSEQNADTAPRLITTSANDHCNHKTSGTDRDDIASGIITSGSNLRSQDRPISKTGVFSQFLSNILPRIKMTGRSEETFDLSKSEQSDCSLVSAVNTEVVMKTLSNMEETNESKPSLGQSFTTNNSEVTLVGRCPKIGVSSLTCKQKQPMTVFMSSGYGMSPTESEPNLYSSHMWSSLSPSSDACYHAEDCLRRYTNQQPLNGSIEIDSARMHSSDIEFPFIPPPPGYRNNKDSEHTQNCEESVRNGSLIVSQENISSQKQQEFIQGYQHTSQASHKTLVELDQLQKKSVDMDLPFISALFKDRSLLMLPKTVPTCSRQRHLGIGKDVRRFSCSCVTSLFREDRCLSSTGNLPELLQSESRPVSWHFGSMSTS
ncbi:protein expanded-like isoform X2 [Limulus polyphemus]|uniref:Protein expanded-like isoform X2 n=1 Tax=Limulus polyphemus TaxID=6850 RepID=A0ABM1TCH2_LIMPO|nr:protein expanded-like isoform X2 [Limulus polyphemus]